MIHVLRTAVSDGLVASNELDRRTAAARESSTRQALAQVVLDLPASVTEEVLAGRAAALDARPWPCPPSRLELQIRALSEKPRCWFAAHWGVAARVLFAVSATLLLAAMIHSGGLYPEWPARASVLPGAPYFRAVAGLAPVLALIGAGRELFCFVLAPAPPDDDTSVGVGALRVLLWLVIAGAVLVAIPRISSLIVG